jgi:hypothetical protein
MQILNNINFITGEKIQLITNLILGLPNTINQNPNIRLEHNNVQNINNINSYFDNPKYIYLYADCYDIFKNKLHFFNNPFVLVSNNSDYAVVNNEICSFITNHPKVIKWFAQNLIYEHPKLELLPIGFANKQWIHGNQNAISNTIKNLDNIKKINNIYFYFSINTNFNKRNDCYQKLKNYIPVSDKKSGEEYFDYLATFKFAICPEGNGFDTHRLWECFYFKVIPIVLYNEFIRLVKKKYNYFPMIILNDWTDLIGMELKYNSYDNSQKLDVNIIINEILNT